MLYRSKKNNVSLVTDYLLVSIRYKTPIISGSLLPVDMQEHETHYIKAGGQIDIIGPEIIQQGQSLPLTLEYSLKLTPTAQTPLDAEGKIIYIDTQLNRNNVMAHLHPNIVPATIFTKPNQIYPVTEHHVWFSEPQDRISLTITENSGYIGVTELVLKIKSYPKDSQLL